MTIHHQETTRRFRLSRRFGLLCSLLLITVLPLSGDRPGQLLWGQEEATPADSTPATPPPATPPAEEMPPATPVDPEAKPDANPSFVYIPYEKLNDMFDRLKSKVVISYEEYRDLLKRAAEQSAVVSPPAAAIISSASYTATINGDMAEVTAVLECLALQKQWAEIPVQFGTAAVGELTTNNGQKVLLRGTGEGTYSLLFEAAGPVQVTLKLLVPVTNSPTGPQLGLTVPPVGITTFSLTVPKPDYEITITPRSIPVKAAEPAPADVSQVRVNLGAAEKISASWVPRTSQRPEMDLLTTVQNTLQVSIRDGLIHTDANLQYKIMRGELTSLRIAVPLNQRILDVTSSSRLQGWQVVKEEQRQIIEAQLLGAVKETVSIEVYTEQALTAEAVRVGGIDPAGMVHGIHALDVTREQGTLTVQPGEELSLVVSQQSGLVRTETGTATASTPQRLTFRYYSPQFDFELRAEPLQPILDVRHDAALIFREQRLETDVRLQYTIRRAGAFHLEIELPDGLTLTGVDCPQMAEYQHDQSSRVLKLVFKEQTQGAVPVRLRGHFPLPTEDEAQAARPLPLCVPLQVRQEEGQVAVFTVEAMELVTEEDQIQSAQPIPAHSLRLAFPDAILRAAWKFQARPVVIPVRTIRRPTRMTAETASQIRVEPSGVMVETMVTYHIQYAGVDQFRIAVPARVSDRIQIEVAGPNDTPILQKSPEANSPKTEEESPPAEEADSTAATEEAGGKDNSLPAPEMVIWQIQTQRPVTGRQQFKITYDLPFQKQAEAENAPLQETIPILRPLGLTERTPSGPALTRSSGEISIETDASQAVALQPSGRGIEPIDLRELTLLPATGQQAFRYAMHTPEEALQIRLTISRFDVEAVVSTVVPRMLMEYVVGTSDKLAVRALIRLKTSQRQRLLLQLPAEVQPMQILVNQEPRQLQKGEASKKEGWANYFVNVSRTGNSDEEFLLTVQYLQTIPVLSQTTPRSEVNLAIPQVLSPEGAPAVVQQSRCLVWLPEQYVPVRVADPFERINPLRRITLRHGILSDNSEVDETRQWLGGGLASGLDFPTGGLAYRFEAVGASDQLELTCWNRTIVMIALTTALLVIAFILMRTSWENKILVLLVTFVVLAAAMQYEAGVIKQGLYSARLGLFALAGIWLVHGLFSCSRFCCGGETTSSVEENTEVEETVVENTVVSEEIPENKPPYKTEETSVQPQQQEETPPDPEKPTSSGDAS